LRHPFRTLSQKAGKLVKKPEKTETDGDRALLIEKKSIRKAFRYSKIQKKK